MTFHDMTFFDTKFDFLHLIKLLILSHNINVVTFLRQGILLYDILRNDYNLTREKHGHQLVSN